MKKIISLLSALTIMMTAFFVVKADTVEIPANRPHITGTFIQAWLYSGWSDQRLDEEFANMKDIGIQYIIMGDTLNATKTTSGDYHVTYTSYPSTVLDGANVYSGKDLLDELLYYCQKYGMKCYLGMGNDTDWSFIYAGHRDQFIKFAQLSCAVATDIYNQYKAKYPDSFYGFYFTPELCNCASFNKEADRNDCVSFLSDGFNMILDTINKLDPTMPLFYSPYANTASYNATLQNTQTFYTEFYKKTNFRSIDILAPQDSVGAGGVALDLLDSWTKMYKDAVTASGKDVHLWSNCEDFVQPRIDGDNWTSADVKRFVKQMQITSQYCEQIVTFAYPHYWSPYNTDPGFNKAYVEYLKTGEIDDVAPTTPTKVAYSKYISGATIKWTPATDDYDIARYNLYKYDSSSKKFVYVGGSVVLRQDGGSVVPKLATQCFVDNLSGSTIFALEAMDCVGNYSQKVIFQVDLSKTCDVDLTKSDGATGITTVVDDLDQYAQQLQGGTSTTAPTTETTATETSGTSSASSTSTVTVTTEAQPDTTGTVGDTTTAASETTESPKTGAPELASLLVLSAAALGLTVAFKRKK